MSGKVMGDRVKSSVSKLWPLQVGFGVDEGCERAIHSTRTFLESQSKSFQLMLKLDCRNAFNCVRQDKIMECLMEFTPEYAR